ncbi:NEW3 domain-containing protein [Thermococcus sp.]|uniref:COG1470 family protein n=1 Tax=Thermococcus sp. TaxID=35749 RepID=UPI0026189271|nr:NEW3 domain-containing protein [Thermococcus sp.]
MKRFVALLLVSLALVQLAGAQPYVTVFEDRLSPGQALEVGNYTVTLVQSVNGSPYLILKSGDRVLELKPFVFGSTMESDGVRIVMGSYTSQGGFLIVSVRARFVTSLKPEVGARVSFNGTTVEVIAIGNDTVSVSVNGITKSLVVNGSAVVGTVALEYDGKAIRVYKVPRIARVETAEYSVFYPYRDVRVSGAFDVPVTVTSLTEKELTLKLEVLTLPPGWKASFLYGGVEVSEITLPPRGTISLTLHVEPSGSGTIEFSVGNVVGSIHVESEGVEVSIPYLSLEAEAGSVLKIPVSFLGSGLVEFSPGNLSPGWEVYLISEGYRLRSFKVKGSFPASLVVAIPRNATLGDHRVSFLINGKTYGIDVYVYKTYLGQPARLTVILTDESGNPVRGWVAVGDKNITVSPSGSAVFELKPGEYTVRAGCEGCSQAVERVKLSDGEEKTLKIELQRAEYYFKAELSQEIVTARPGVSASTQITITNLGSKADEYRITVEGLPEGWSYFISQDPRGASPLGSVKVESGGSATVYLIITPPFNVESGDVDVKVIVSGRSLERTLPLRIHVENPASLTLNVDTPLLTVRAGGTTATNLWVDSDGTVTNVKFSVQAPNGWDVEVIPQTIPRVGAEMQGNVIVSRGPVKAEVRIRVPKSTPAGTYTVTITAAGDQAKAQTVITVRVTQGSSGAWIGITLLLVAFGIVVWLMRRVGRR